MEDAEVIGKLDDAERAIINERDGYCARFFEAETDEERDRLMDLIDDAVRRYDELRAAKWDRGEVV